MISWERLKKWPTYLPPLNNDYENNSLRFFSELGHPNISKKCVKSVYVTKRLVLGGVNGPFVLFPALSDAVSLKASPALKGESPGLVGCDLTDLDCCGMFMFLEDANLRFAAVFCEDLQFICEPAVSE